MDCYKFIHVDSDNGTIIKVVSKEMCLDEILKDFKAFCLACGFYSSSVDKIVFLGDDEEVVDKDVEDLEEDDV